MVLGSQDALPVATAFTEYVHAYFRGHSPRYTVVGQMVTSKQGFLGAVHLGSSRASVQRGFMICFTMVLLQIVL